MLPSGRTRIAGITGDPVTHSLSPRLHNYWLGQLGLDGLYVPFPAAPADFDLAMRGLAAAGVAGVNVTIPHKEAAFQLADTLDAAARAIGAVNTLVFADDGKITGRNTDAPGFISNLKEAGTDVSRGTSLILGAGGAARAAVFALLVEGVDQVIICNRSRDRAEILATDLQAEMNIAADRLTVRDWDGRSDLSGIDLLVNTTSLGMTGKGDLEIDLGALPDHAVVHDIVYVPLQTPLLARAAARGLKTVDGLGMLLHQARPAFEAFFGVDPVVDQELRDFVLAG